VGHRQQGKITDPIEAPEAQLGGGRPTRHDQPPPGAASLMLKLSQIPPATPGSLKTPEVWHETAPLTNSQKFDAHTSSREQPASAPTRGTHECVTAVSQ
jgi:hypothetical protein